MSKQKWKLSELGSQYSLPNGGTIERRLVRDPHHSPMTVLVLHNGMLRYTILPERGMDVGEIHLAEERMSWERSEEYLVHPEHVNLQDGNGTGWLNGFYGAIASIGPELFGTPGEGYTLHGSGSYSPADPETVTVEYDHNGVTVEGTVKVRGSGGCPLFEKRVRMFSRWGSSAIQREETTLNVSGIDRTLDDGYHIQLSGPFLHAGGRYVLPVPREELLLRDSAPSEADPLRIPPLRQGKTPIRCYQYVPRPVRGLADVSVINSYLPSLDASRGTTAEMLVNEDASAAGFVVRPLSCFPRSLIAKEISDSFMFALEPCRTRPNRMSQKHTDGEAFTLRAGETDTTQCLIGVTRDREAIKALNAAIEAAANPPC